MYRTTKVDRVREVKSLVSGCVKTLPLCTRYYGGRSAVN